MPDAAPGVAYSHTVAVAGGNGGNTWSISSGALPAGLSLSTTAAGTGLIEGTPIAAATASFQLRVQDNSGQEDIKDATLAVIDPAIPGGPLVYTSAIQFDIMENQSFTLTLSVTGGTAPYSWACTAKPAWVIDAAGGALTGTAPAFGITNVYDVAFTVADSSLPPGPNPVPQLLSQTIQLTVIAGSVQPPPPVITTTWLPVAYETYAYSAQLAATGGTPPYKNWMFTGLLPSAGLSLDAATGVLSGTPAVGSSGSQGLPVQYSLWFTVEDSAGAASPFGHVINFEIQTITPLVVSTTTLADGFVGTPYSQTLVAVGGPAPHSWSYISGLPTGTGLSLAADGTLAGTPAVADAAFNVIEVEVLDGIGRTQRGSVSFAIFNGPPTLTISADLPAAGVGSTAPGIGAGARCYEGWMTASGGIAPYQFAIASRGTLPEGFELDPTGVLRGWNAPGTGGQPSAMGTGGTYTFAVRVADAQHAYCVDNISIEVVPCPGSTVMPVLSVLPTAYEGVPYSFKPTAAMPAGLVSTLSNPYHQVSLMWEHISGAIPAGLTIFENSSGTEGWVPEIMGTPAYGSTGPYTLEFQIWDAYVAAPKVTWTCTLNIATAPFHIVNRRNLVGGLAGQPYGDKLVAAGGQGANILWTVRSGSGTLPAGVTLDAATGEVNGTIAASTTPGTYSCIVDATENIAGGATGSFKANIVVGAAPAPGSLVKIAGGGKYVDGYYDGVAAVNALIGDIWGIAFDTSGNLLLAETRYASRVRIVDRKTRMISTVAGRRGGGGSSGINGPAINASVGEPTGIAVDATGAVYIGTLGGFLRKIDSAGIMRHVAQLGSQYGHPELASVAINPAGTHMYVASGLRHDVVEIELQSGALTDIIAGQTDQPGNSGDSGPGGSAYLNQPVGLGFDAQGNLYITELGLSSMFMSEPRVRKVARGADAKISSNSIITTLGGTVGTGPNSDLAVDGSGHLYYVTDAGIAVLDLATPGLAPVYLAGVGQASFSDKRGLAKDPINGDIYVSSQDACIYKIAR